MQLVHKQVCIACHKRKIDKARRFRVCQTKNGGYAMNYGSLLPVEPRRDRVAHDPQTGGRFGRWLRGLAGWIPH